MGVLASIVAWAHIGAVVVAVGGSAFVLFVLRPLVLRTMEPSVAMSLMGAVQLRFRWLIWGAILVLVVTGVWMAMEFRGITSLQALTHTSFGQTLVVKSLLSIVFFAGALSVTLPISWLASFRRHQVAIFRFNLLGAVVITLLATLMVRQGGVF